MYANTFQVVADQLYDKTIPMVYPLSARTEELGRFPNFIQVNTSATTLLENMADWVVKNSIGANLVVIRPSGDFRQFGGESIAVFGKISAATGYGDEDDKLEFEYNGRFVENAFETAYGEYYFVSYG